MIREIEAAAILGVSHQRVNQLRAEGKLSAVDVSGMGHTRILYRLSEGERLRAERGDRPLRPDVDNVVRAMLPARVFLLPQNSSRNNTARCASVDLCTGHSPQRLDQVQKRDANPRPGIGSSE